jgi:hypothetical protein
MDKQEQALECGRRVAGRRAACVPARFGAGTFVSVIRQEFEFELLVMKYLTPSNDWQGVNSALKKKKYWQGVNSAKK